MRSRAWTFGLIICTLWASSCAAPTHAVKPEIVSFRSSIIIDVPIAAAFAFAADPANDYLWRREVRVMTGSGPLRAGTIYKEIADIGLEPQLRMQVVVERVQKPNFVRFTSTATIPRLFVSERLFQRLSPTRTQFTGDVFVDTRIIKDVWPLPTPLALAKLYYESIMDTYLQNLKALLERRRWKGHAIERTWTDIDQHP